MDERLDFPGGFRRDVRKLAGQADGAINPMVGPVGASIGQGPVQRLQKRGGDRRAVSVPYADNSAHE